MASAAEKTQAEADIGRILATYLDVLSMTAPSEVVRIVRNLIIHDREGAISALATAMRTLGMGALARNIEEAL